MAKIKINRLLELQNEVLDFIRKNELNGLSETKAIRGAFESLYDKLRLYINERYPNINFDREISIIQEGLVSLYNKQYINKNQKKKISALLAKLNNYFHGLDEFSR